VCVCVCVCVCVSGRVKCEVYISNGAAPVDKLRSEADNMYVCVCVCVCHPLTYSMCVCACVCLYVRVESPRSICMLLHSVSLVRAVITAPDEALLITSRSNCLSESKNTSRSQTAAPICSFGRAGTQKMKRFMTGSKHFNCGVIPLLHTCYSLTRILLFQGAIRHLGGTDLVIFKARFSRQD